MSSIIHFGKELGAFIKTLKWIRVFVPLRWSKSAYGVKERVNWRENDWLVSIPRLAILSGGFLTMTKRISSRYS